MRTPLTARAHRRLTVLVLSALMGVSTPARALPSQDFPNLQMLLPTSIGVDFDDDGFRRALRFGVAVQNTGPGALEIAGTPSGGGLGRASATQCVARTGPACSATRDAGTLHFYTLFTDYIEPCYALEGALSYELRHLAGTEPDFTPGGLVNATGAIAATFADDRPDFASSFGPPTYTMASCGGFARQGLSPGWILNRASDERGQFITLDTLSGTFALVVRTNPQGLLAETTTQDNLAWVAIDIQGNDVTIL